MNGFEKNWGLKKIQFQKSLGFQKSNKFQKNRTKTTTFLEQNLLKKNWGKKIGIQTKFVSQNN